MLSDCDVIECASESNQYTACSIDEWQIITSVSVENKISKAACEYNAGTVDFDYSDGGIYGYIDNLLWVNGGCRADFEVCYVCKSQTRIIWAATWQNQQNECAPNEDSDQPGHPPSLIRVFAVRSMGS